MKPAAWDLHHGLCGRQLQITATPAQADIHCGCDSWLMDQTGLPGI